MMRFLKALLFIGALILSLPNPAFATITFIDSVASTPGASGATLTAPAQNVTAGNFLFISASWSGFASISGCTDTALDTGANVVLLTQKNRGDGFFVQQAFIWNTNGSAANVVACTISTSIGNGVITVEQYSHVKSSANPLDIQATGTAGGPDMAPTLAAFSTSYANDLIIVSVVRGSATTPAMSYTERHDLNYMSVEDIIVGTLQSSITPGFATTSSDTWGIVGAAFKDDSAVAVVPKGSLLGVGP